MKQMRYGFIFMAILISLPLISYGEDMVVPTYVPGGKYLNEWIVGDTLQDGSHPADRVYVLSRDNVYFVNSSISNIGWPLKIRASYGIGYQPVIFLLTTVGGTLTPVQMINNSGNVWLSNLFIAGYDEGNSAKISTMNMHLILTGAVGYDIVIDSCTISNFAQSFIRTNSSPRVLKLTNSILANMGYIGTIDIGSGRAIDLRNGSCDSLIIMNNTFINSHDRIVRHLNSTLSIKYLKFDHNTIVNSAALHGVFALGLTEGQCSFTNNLFIDPFALGNDTDFVRQAEFGNNRENDFRGLARMTWINAFPDSASQVVPTQWTIKNNYYSVSNAGQTFYDANAAAGVTGEGSPLPWHINAKLGADSINAFNKVIPAIVLNKAPALGTALINWYRDPAGANKTKQTGTWTPDKDYNRISYIYIQDSLDCRYSTSLSIYTAAAGGQPVGALTWWNMTPATGVENDPKGIVSGFALRQNYPNPFNPSTNISYSVEKAGLVSVKVFDILGREVATIVNEVKQAGNYVAEWNASRLCSGIYFYKMQAGAFSAAKKMILMK